MSEPCKGCEVCELAEELADEREGANFLAGQLLKTEAELVASRADRDALAADLETTRQALREAQVLAVGIQRDTPERTDANYDAIRIIDLTTVALAAVVSDGRTGEGDG